MSITPTVIPTDINLSTSVDDSTIEYVDSKLRLKDDGIVTAKIGDEQVTNSKINAGYLSVGDTALISDNTQRNNANGVWAKDYEFLVTTTPEESQSIRFKWSYKGDGGNNKGRARSYKNGNPLGDIQESVNTWYDISEDIPVSNGDTVELWTYNIDATYVFTKNVSICYDPTIDLWSVTSVKVTQSL